MFDIRVKRKFFTMTPEYELKSIIVKTLEFIEENGLDVSIDNGVLNDRLVGIVSTGAGEEIGKHLESLGYETHVEEM
ncbi:MAG: hypothetical protein ACOYJB_09010 [Christensenellaceae bacterium]|jgi:hypothetical protein